MKLVLFDIDGTLMYARGCGRESTRLAMLDVFGTVGTLETHAFEGKTDWFTLTELLRSEGFDEHTVSQHIPAYNEAIASHLERIIVNYPVEACPGAIEVVHALRAREDVLLGIITGNVALTAPIKLRASGFDPAWFQIGAYGSEAVHRNDLPPLAITRAEHLARRTFPSQDIWIIGDTLSDIACARAAGARAVAVATGFAPVETLRAANPDFLLETLHPLPNMIQ